MMFLVPICHESIQMNIFGSDQWPSLVSIITLSFVKEEVFHYIKLVSFGPDVRNYKIVANQYYVLREFQFHKSDIQCTAYSIKQSCSDVSVWKAGLYHTFKICTLFIYTLNTHTSSNRSNHSSWHGIVLLTNLPKVLKVHVDRFIFLPSTRVSDWAVIVSETMSP